MCPAVQFASLPVLQLWFFGHHQLGLHIICQAVLSGDPTVGNDLFGISTFMVCMMTIGEEPNDMYAKHITNMQHATCLLCTSTNCLTCYSLNVNTNTRQSFIVMMLRCWSAYQLLHREHEERGGNGSH